MTAKTLGRWLIAFFAVVVAFIGFVYLGYFAKTEVVSSASGDGRYRLTVYMIGEPDWPFGETHCRFDLSCEGKRIIKHPFSIWDDGSAARESNFAVAWNTDNVTIIVSGSEQKDETYVLNFDGTVG